jgi:hypothetical protein
VRKLDDAVAAVVRALARREQDGSRVKMLVDKDGKVKVLQFLWLKPYLHSRIYRASWSPKHNRRVLRLATNAIKAYGTDKFAAKIARLNKEVMNPETE